MMHRIEATIAAADWPFLLAHAGLSILAAGLITALYLRLSGAKQVPGLLVALVAPDIILALGLPRLMPMPPDHPAVISLLQGAALAPVLLFPPLAVLSRLPPTMGRTAAGLGARGATQLRLLWLPLLWLPVTGGIVAVTLLAGLSALVLRISLNG